MVADIFSDWHLLKSHIRSGSAPGNVTAKSYHMWKSKQICFNWFLGEQIYSTLQNLKFSPTSGQTYPNGVFKIFRFLEDKGQRNKVC